VTLRCRNLPLVGQVLVDETGGLTAPGPVCPVLHELRGDGVCRDRAQGRGASMHASKLIGGPPRIAARLREVDGIELPPSATASVLAEIVGTKRLYQSQSPLGLVERRNWLFPLDHTTLQSCWMLPMNPGSHRHVVDFL